jgi:uncharacterized repeat protein (TIGR01451 family)
MRTKLLLAIILGLLASEVRLGYGQSTDQTTGQPNSNTPILDKLGQFGRKVFGSQPKPAAKPAPKPAASPATQPPAALPAEAAADPRAGTAFGDAKGTTIVAAPALAPAAAPARLEPDKPDTLAPVQVADPSPAPPAMAPQPAADDTSTAPLHERLSAARSSPFDTPDSDSHPKASPSTSDGPSIAPPMVATPTLAPPTIAPPVADGGMDTSVPTSRAIQPEKDAPATAPTITDDAPRPPAYRPAVSDYRPAASAPTLAPPARLNSARSGTAASNGYAPRAFAPAPTRSVPSDAMTSKPSEPEGALIARGSPVLSVETTGPRKIVVGKASTYEVTIQNSGEVTADQVVVTVDLPEWTDVNRADPSIGTTESLSGTAAGPRQLAWRIPRLEAKSRERLSLRIVPRQSRPFDLAIRWVFTPTASRAMIEVQEPKLSIKLQGPHDVVFGKSAIYRLEVANLGNGDAENVTVSLVPAGMADRQAAATHPFGIIQAGRKKAIEVELTARQTGNLTISTEARADGGIRVQLAEPIFVRRARLQVEMEGPRMQFVGTDATFRIRVSNPGNAPTGKTTVTAMLPPGIKYLSSQPTGQVNGEGNRVTWTLDDVAAGKDTTLLLTCGTTVAGPARVEVRTTADRDLVALASVDTRVEAEAELVLSVDNPGGPVTLDDEAVYTLHLKNRGTANAENIEVVLYFSNGLEPVSADGARSRLSPGQVNYESIPSLGTGQSLALTVKAKAQKAGNHVFRVEVHSKPSGDRLVNEGTTRFFGEGAAGPTMMAQPAPKPLLAPAATPIRAADRRESIVPRR